MARYLQLMMNPWKLPRPSLSFRFLQPFLGLSLMEEMMLGKVQIFLFPIFFVFEKYYLWLCYFPVMPLALS